MCDSAPLGKGEAGRLAGLTSAASFSMTTYLNLITLIIYICIKNIYQV